MLIAVLVRAQGETDWDFEDWEKCTLHTSASQVQVVELYYAFWRWTNDQQKKTLTSTLAILFSVQVYVALLLSLFFVENIFQYFSHKNAACFIAITVCVEAYWTNWLKVSGLYAE